MAFARAFTYAGQPTDQTGEREGQCDATESDAQRLHGPPSGSTAMLPPRPTLADVRSLTDSERMTPPPTATASSIGPHGAGPAVWRAMLVVWVVVNLVNVLQGAGFASRTPGPGGMSVNNALGVVIAVLALPATWALVVFVRERAGWLQYLGPLAFDAFVVLMLVIDYALTLEFRDPQRPAILAPYLLLFFGSIVLMGSPMYRSSRPRWAFTAVTSALLLAAMAYALARGVG